MIKWVSHPFAFACPGNASKPLLISIFYIPNAGMNTRNPTPAERFKAKGL